MLEGNATLIIGKKKYKLSQGNSFYFVSNKKHYIVNDGDTPVKILWVSSPPTF